MTLFERYQHAKLALGAQFQTSDSMLHIHAGLAIYLGSRLLIGRHRSPVYAWAVVVAIEAANEIVDRLTYGSWRAANTTNDVIQTLLWPTALMLVRLTERARRRR